MEEVPLDKMAQEGFSDVTPESGARGSQAAAREGCSPETAPRAPETSSRKGLRKSWGGQGPGEKEVAKWQGDHDEAGETGTCQTTQGTASHGKMMESNEEQERATESWYMVTHDFDDG